MKKAALFAFNGDFMCFIHVLLNVLDMNENGDTAKVIIEGSATKLIPELAKPGSPMHPLYKKVKELGLIEGVCKACSNKMGTLDAARQEGFALLDEMSGHPSMVRFRDAGFDIISF